MNKAEQIKQLRNTSPTWPGQHAGDMRLKRNRDALKMAASTGHVRPICVADNSFQGARTTWEFSNELNALL